jgi:hypothetical protein
MRTFDCPSDQQLASFSAGLSGDSDAALVEEHLPACAGCVARLHTLETRDIVLDLARKQATAAARPCVDAPVQTLIDTLKGLGSSSTDLAETQIYRKDASTLHGIFEPPEESDDLGRLGSYRILRLIGSGGMGMVFEARDTELNRIVAIKMQRPSSAGDPRARDRFLAEARAVASIEHDHIVPIFHIGERSDIPFFVMPYLQGESLEARHNPDPPEQETEIRRINAEIDPGL